VPFLVSTVLFTLAAATWSCAERQSGLPLKKGRAATMTRDYERHGTITLFAALDVKSGLVTGICMPRRRQRSSRASSAATDPGIRWGICSSVDELEINLRPPSAAEHQAEAFVWSRTVEDIITRRAAR
jgi:hypothetical protein